MDEFFHRDPQAMANDESRKIEPTRIEATLTSIGDAPSIAPVPDAFPPRAVTAEGSATETAKVEPKPSAPESASPNPAAPKSEDILAELARNNAKNSPFLKSDSILAEVARAKAAAAKPESGIADAAASATAAAPKPEVNVSAGSRLYIEPGVEKEPKLERKPKPESKAEPTPEARRQ